VPGVFQQLLPRPALWDNDRTGPWEEIAWAAVHGMHTATGTDMTGRPLQPRARAPGHPPWPAQLMQAADGTRAWALAALRGWRCRPFATTPSARQHPRQARQATNQKGRGIQVGPLLCGAHRDARAPCARHLSHQVSTGRLRAHPIQVCTGSQPRRDST